MAFRIGVAGCGGRHRRQRYVHRSCCAGDRVLALAVEHSLEICDWIGAGRYQHQTAHAHFELTGLIQFNVGRRDLPGCAGPWASAYGIGRAGKWWCPRTHTMELKEVQALVVIPLLGTSRAEEKQDRNRRD